MPKHTFLVPTDNLAAFNLPPGYSLHAPDGLPINPDQVAAYLARGEKIEIYHEGRSVGRFRQSEMADRFSPASIDVMGRMLEQAKAENFSEAINWIDRDKGRFWCPVCAKNQSHPEIVSAWVSPECKPICYYAICRRCGKQGHHLQANAHRNLQVQEAFTRIADLAEQRIIARYPHIAENLPPGYMDRSNGSNNTEIQEESSFPAGHMMIPNPVHPAKDGELPEIVCRRYLVIRVLPLPKLLDLQTSLIWRLGEQYPLVTVCKGGEEPERLEAWFKVENWTEEACRAFMDFACSLGADPETFNPQCFVHLPGATNPATGKVQKLLYLDPEGKNFPDGPTPLAQKRSPKS
jgi:hypothetical protein